MLTIDFPKLTKEEEEEFKNKYVVDGKINWKKFCEDISEEFKKDIKERSEKSRRWQEWAIKFSTPSD